MNEYTASNGAVVKWAGVSGCVHRLDVGLQPVELDLSEWQALREFFAAERDAELGRERDPENPDFVFYPGSNNKLDDDYVNVLNEPKGTGHGAYYRESMGQRAAFGKSYNGRDLDEYERAAIRYFVAHPKPEPKPWQDAKPGEVWSVTTGDRSGEAWTLEGGAFMFDDEGFVRSSEITAAHRIYPPAEES